MKIAIYIICTVLGYMICSFSMSHLLAKLKKKDLRSGGSGNLGASNTTILMGIKYGVLVGAVDIFKGSICVFAVRLLFPDMVLLHHIVAAACVMGHMFPFYLKFKGGKGFATTIGVMFGLYPLTTVVVAVCIILVAIISNYLIISTILTAIAFPLIVCIKTWDWISGWVIAVPMSIIVFKHIPNVMKIFKGEEFKVRDILFKKKNKDKDK